MVTKYQCITCAELGLPLEPYSTRAGAEWHVTATHLPSDWTDDDLAETVRRVDGE